MAVSERSSGDHAGSVVHVANDPSALDDLVALQRERGWQVSVVEADAGAGVDTCDVLHLHGAAMSSSAARALVRGSRGVVATPDDLDDLDGAEGWQRIGARLGLWRSGRHVDTYAVRTRHHRDLLASAGVSGHVRVVPEGIDLRRFDPTRTDLPERDRVRAHLGAVEDDLLIGTIGPLVDDHAWPVVLDAFREASTRREGLRMVAVGRVDATAPGALPQSAVQRSEQDEVTFLGVPDDLEGLVRALDVVVLPSTRDGNHRRAMEAAALGVPTFAPFGGQAADAIESGRTGELFTARPNTLPYLLQRAAVDRTWLRALGDGARRMAELEFDAVVHAERILALYEELLASD